MTSADPQRPHPRDLGLAEARALADLLEAKKAHANLIPYNPVPGLPYERPSAEAVRRFEAVLKGRGLSVSVRKTKGREIDAACGQLRRRSEDGAAIGAGLRPGIMAGSSPKP